MTPQLDRILSKLHYKKRLAEGVWAAWCPVHVGADGDLEIIQCPHCGKISMRCKAGCSPVKILKAAKLKARDLDGEGEEAGKNPKINEGTEAKRNETP